MQKQHSASAAHSQRPQGNDGSLFAFTIDNFHPLSGHQANDPETIAAIGYEAMEKMEKLFWPIKQMAASDGPIAGLADIALDIVQDFKNIFDCDLECYRDAREAAARGEVRSNG